MGSAVCNERGCENPAVAVCAYRDRRGAGCNTSWCQLHQRVVGGAVFCARHAGVVQALLTVPEDERDFPDVNNRAPSLCEWVALSIEPPVLYVMQEMATRRPGATVVRDGLHLVMAGTPRVRGWEHKWRLVDHTGPLQTAGVRVDETADSLVQIKVNGRIVHGATPPWISNREPISAEEDTQRRVEFHQSLVDQMVVAMREQIGFS